MKTARRNIRLIFSFTALVAFVAAVATSTQAGGPLLLGNNGQPVLWPRRAIQGGPLGSRTVDESGNVLYRVDQGGLGPIPNDRAVRFIDRIFNLYSSIPTSTLKFVNAGPIIDPTTRQPMDVTSSNIGRVRSSANPTFQNPIVFDSDGSITGGGGVLGFFSFIQLDRNNSEVREGIVVLNGAAVERLGEIPFLGVFTHEFGHFAGPLDHAQINGAIASGSSVSVQPAGFSRAQVFDLFMPFTETLYPFIFPGSSSGPPAGSQLASGNLGNSGYFIASLDLDTRTALSNLYPTPDYLATTGAIEGRVLLRTNSGDIPITGVNVVARRISKGSYPPATSATAFLNFPTTSIQLDDDGVPVVPPDQESTDSLSTAVSTVSGVEYGAGRYRLQGLPAGQYLIGVQRLNPSAVGGSGIGPLDQQLALPVLEQFYNGSNDPSTNPATFMPVPVSIGQTATGIDLILGGFNSTLAPVSESEPNQKVGKAQSLEGAVDVTGSASDIDPGKFKMELPDGSVDRIEDLYRFTVTQTRTYFIVLEPLNGAAGDLDMYLINPDLLTILKRAAYDDDSVVNYSAGPTGNELMAMLLPPGTYVIGVSAFEGSSLNYRLRVIPAQ